MARTISKLAHVSDDSFIQTCLQATDLNAASTSLGIAPKTMREEFSRRRLPCFTVLRSQHGVRTKREVQSIWTQEMVDRMHELHLAGLSAALIGEQIGMSKNSVIGKAHRLGLTLGAPTKRMPETKVRGPRPPSTLKGVPRPPRAPTPPKPPRPPRQVIAIVPASNFRGLNSPKPIPSGVRQLAAARLATATRASDRAMVEQAIAAGRVTKLPSGHAWGTKITWLDGMPS